MNSDTESLYEA